MTELFDFDKTPKTEAFQETISRLTNNVLQNLWGYTDRSAESLYAILDMRTGEIKSFISIGGVIVKIEDLTKYRGRHKFNRTVEDEKKLDYFMAQEAKQVYDLFIKNRKRVPNRILVGVNTATATGPMILDYSSAECELRSMDDEALNWMRKLRGPYFQYQF